MTTDSIWPPTLGTPCSAAAVRVLLLGAGELGKEVLIALQRLGVETIAVDRYAGAPGHQVAHRSHVIDMADRRWPCVRLIEAERPHIVVPEIEAIATEALVEIETRRRGASRPDRTRGAPDDEPRRHPPAGGGNTGAADLALPLRQFR